MSGPVPSPRINGMIGMSGTFNPPAETVIFSPAGTVVVVYGISGSSCAPAGRAALHRAEGSLRCAAPCGAGGPAFRL